MPVSSACSAASRSHCIICFAPGAAPCLVTALLMVDTSPEAAATLRSSERSCAAPVRSPVWRSTPCAGRPRSPPASAAPRAPCCRARAAGSGGSCATLAERLSQLGATPTPVERPSPDHASSSAGESAAPHMAARLAVSACDGEPSASYAASTRSASRSCVMAVVASASRSSMPCGAWRAGNVDSSEDGRGSIVWCARVVGPSLAGAHKCAR